MTERQCHVVERNGWYYVLDEDGREFEYSGPWRYRIDAQEYRDELNGTRGEVMPGTREGK